MGIETPLDTMFIVLQNGRERNQKGLSKQDVNVILLFVKGMKLLGPNQWA